MDEYEISEEEKRELLGKRIEILEKTLQQIWQEVVSNRILINHIDADLAYLESEHGIE